MDKSRFASINFIKKYYVIFCGVVAPLSFFVVFPGFTILCSGILKLDTKMWYIGHDSNNNLDNVLIQKGDLPWQSIPNRND